MESIRQLFRHIFLGFFLLLAYMNDYQDDTKNKIGERLNAFRKEMGLSQKELAQLVEANQGNVSNVIKGIRAMPKIWTYKLKEKYARLNDDWIITGNGQMLISEILVNNFSLKDPIPSGTISEPFELYSGNARELTRKELERMVLHLSYRVGVLEEKVAGLEDAKREAISMMDRTKK